MWRRLVRSMFDPDPDPRYLDRFGWLLLLTYLTVAAQMLVDFEKTFSDIGAEIGVVGAQLVATAMLLLALRACGVERRWRTLLTIMALAGLGARLLLLTGTLLSRSQGDQVRAFGPWGSLLLVSMVFLFVVFRLARHRRVTSATLLGAITAYLLIPLIFYDAFVVVDSVQSTPFFGRPVDGPEYMYFSLTTVTTLGFSDPSPATSIGQLLAATEALVGQLFLVVVVALIVGLMASRWSNRAE
jgi:Ion channel